MVCASPLPLSPAFSIVCAIIGGGRGGDITYSKTSVQTFADPQGGIPPNAFAFEKAYRYLCRLVGREGDITLSKAEAIFLPKSKRMGRKESQEGIDPAESTECLCL
jgi:hypothetical protein